MMMMMMMMRVTMTMVQNWSYDVLSIKKDKAGPLFAA